MGHTVLADAHARRDQRGRTVDRQRPFVETDEQEFPRWSGIREVTAADVSCIHTANQNAHLLRRQIEHDDIGQRQIAAMQHGVENALLRREQVNPCMRGLTIGVVNARDLLHGATVSMRTAYPLVSHDVDGPVSGECSAQRHGRIAHDRFFGAGMKSYRVKRSGIVRVEADGFAIRREKR